MPDITIDPTVYIGRAWMCLVEVLADKCISCCCTSCELLAFGNQAGCNYVIQVAMAMGWVEVRGLLIFDHRFLVNLLSVSL